MTAAGGARITGTRASEISASIEALIESGGLAPGEQLPPVRDLAQRLDVSPTTITSAFHRLRLRGLVTAAGRRGTRVAERRRAGAGATVALPPGTREVSLGNPDPDLLPDLTRALAGAGKSHLYGAPADLPDLLEAAAAAFAADRIPAGSVAVVSGALDGIERVLAAHLRPGDRVIVEDPGYPAVLDLVSALGLRPEPVTVDDRGAEPEAVERALQLGAQGAVLSPRAQNPYGSALDAGRARRLARLFDRRPDVLVVEDDHAGPVAGAPARTSVSARRRRWAVVRSVSKSLGPDLRLALLAGDPVTVARVEARQRIGAGWVSHLLQRAVVQLWRDPKVMKLLAEAAAEYARRRRALLAALGEQGIAAHAASGLNVWVPVDDEEAAAARLLQAGWAVQPGRVYRIQSPPAVRISVGAMRAEEAPAIAAALAGRLEVVPRTRPA